MLIHRYNEQRRMAGGRASPYNFGGDSKSDSSTKTTNNTTNWTDYNDQRVVGQDEAIGLSGNNSVVNRNTSNLTSFIDTSNRSSTSTTEFSDNSDRSTHYTSTTTDHGAVAAGLGLGTKALDMAGATTKAAYDALIVQSEHGHTATQSAFDLTISTRAMEMASGAAVLGFASDAIKETRAAFQEAEDGGNKQIMLYAVLAVAAVGIAMAMRR